MNISRINISTPAFKGFPIHRVQSAAEIAAKGAVNIKTTPETIRGAVNDGAAAALKTVGAKLFSTFIAAPARAVYKLGSSIIKSGGKNPLPAVLPQYRYTMPQKALQSRPPIQFSLEGEAAAIQKAVNDASKKALEPVTRIFTETAQSAAPSAYTSGEAYISRLPGGAKHLTERLY